MKRIPLANSKLFAFVSNKDFEKVSAYKWYLHKKGYACRTKHPCIKLYHFILGKPADGTEWDHKDGNELNCCRSNLRAATHLENTHNQKKRNTNKSGFKGVCRFRNKWIATITVNYKQHFLGGFLSKIEAARAYDKAARKYYGEFARLNFPIQS